MGFLLRLSRFDKPTAIARDRQAAASFRVSPSFPRVHDDRMWFSWRRGSLTQRSIKSTAPRGKPWIERRYEQLDAGQIDPLLKTLDRQVAKHDEARTCADYVRRKRHRMRYAEFHAQGLCTSTGVLEAGCKVVIGTRLTPILFTLVGQTIALCGLFWGGLRPAKFHEKRLDIAACQNGKAAQ